LYPNSGLDEAESHDLAQHWQDDASTHPMLEPESEQVYHTAMDTPKIEVDSFEEISASPPGAHAHTWRALKEVKLVEGNLVLDCPVPPRLLKQIQHASPERESTRMRYSAVTCDPSDFGNERFTLRQRLFAKPRQTELFVVITMYNEEDELFARTMSGVIANIEHMNSRTKSGTWGEESWKKIVVCIVSDGRAKINPRTRAVLAAMGAYQDGIAKQQVNGKDVVAHLYEVSQQNETIRCVMLTTSV
jgi:chitin synthase